MIRSKANAQEKRAIFSFRGTTDFADISICSDTNILPLYDDAEDFANGQSEADAWDPPKCEANNEGGTARCKWQARPFGRSKVHRGMRDAVLWLIHQEGLLKYALRFVDAGYDVGPAVRPKLYLATRVRHPTYRRLLWCTP